MVSGPGVGKAWRAAGAWAEARATTDLVASVVVFLIAVPLSLGIAMASGAPLAAGLLAAIVGGLVASVVGGSVVQVSGPAAGLTVIIAELVQTYGWQATCAITMAAGAVQVAIGLCQISRLVLAMSPAIVHGMLAGIGVVITLAQVHVVLGGSPQESALADLRELPDQLLHSHLQALAVGAVTLGVLIGLSLLPGPAKRIPGQLLAVAVGTVLAWALGSDVPRVDVPDRLLGTLGAPVLPQGDWAGIGAAIATVAIVASVESLLSSTATIRVVATEGQIYARQLQQAGDYTGPHRDPNTATRTGPNSAARTAPLSAGDHSRAPSNRTSHKRPFSDASPSLSVLFRSVPTQPPTSPFDGSGRHHQFQSAWPDPEN